MNTKVMRNVFDRHVWPTRELHRFRFELTADPLRIPVKWAPGSIS